MKPSIDERMSLTLNTNFNSNEIHPFALNISAIIPAAGMSTRMHQYKPLLKLGNITLIETVISLFKKCGINDIIVVVGYNREKIESIISLSGVKTVFNPEFETGMFNSIKKGVKAISHQTHGFFLLPADIPLVHPSTINSIIASFIENPKKIIIPQFNLECGHPPLIPSWLIPTILHETHSSAGTYSNLKELLISNHNHLKRIKVHDRGIVMDADTQADYEKIKSKFKTIDIPDIQECQSIINANLEKEEIIKAHLNLVADTAVKIAIAILKKTEIEESQNQNNSNRSIPNLDVNLIVAGAMLHDIKKKDKNHAGVGAKYLLSLGFPKVADIVAQHMEMPTPIPEHLTEAQIVYFADKICDGNSLELDYYRRFKEKIAKNRDAENTIVKRYEIARLIHTKIEAIAGRTVESILF